MSNSSFSIDTIFNSDSHSNNLNSTGETVQRLFDDAYKMGESTIHEVERQSKPTIDYVAKRVKENPQEVAVEAAGATAALGLLGLAAVNPGSWVVGGLMYGSVAMGGSVVTYETFKQLKEHGYLK